MTNDQKTILLLKIPYINMFKLTAVYDNKIKLIGGNPINYEEEYINKYNNDTGKFNIDINNNKYYYNVEMYSFFNEKNIKDKKYKFIDLITIKDTQEIKLCLISGAHQKIDKNFLECKYKNNIHCGSIAIDILNKHATITSLGNSSKCLKSKNNIEYKYRDILFQIMIHICKKENVKK